MVHKVVRLGVQTVRFGVRGDPKRIKRLVGETKHCLDNELDPNRFAMSENDPEPWRSRKGITSWPEDDKQFELFAVSFDTNLPDYTALLKEANSLSADYQSGGFCHLAAHFSVEKMDAMYGQGISYIETTDEDSLWRSDDGCLYAPELLCTPTCRSIGACWVGYDRPAGSWFLFYREYE